MASSLVPQDLAALLHLIEDDVQGRALDLGDQAPQLDAALLQRELVRQHLDAALLERRQRRAVVALARGEDAVLHEEDRHGSARLVLGERLGEIEEVLRVGAIERIARLDQQVAWHRCPLWRW